MADLSEVHRAVQAGPATHALVIGVGRYPHLLGGDGTRLAEHQGLAQLTSPPASARALATWLVGNFHNPERPLGSVRLLLSEAQPSPFVHPTQGGAVAVPAATADAVAAAFKAWFADGDVHADNLLIFYFCGHGLANGALTTLLLEDFGADPLNPLDGAMDFHGSRLGMSRCKAARQLYLVDACRTDAVMMQNAADYAGRVFVLPKAKVAPVQRPVLYSTLMGAQAYGRAGVPSHFAQALLAAFAGAGGDNSQGGWRVRTTGLHLAIDARMTRQASAGLATAQVPVAEELTTFDVHHLTGAPEVPVVVSCAPAAALPSATMRCLSAGQLIAERPPTNGEWELALRVGSYDFEAAFPPGPFVGRTRSGEIVYPPGRDLSIEVSP